MVKLRLYHIPPLGGDSRILTSPLKQNYIIHPHSERELLTYLKVYDVLGGEKNLLEKM